MVNPKEFLKYAKEDLEVSKLIYEKHIEAYYRHSLYFLIQASEKTLKAFYLGPFRVFLIKIHELEKELDNILII